MVFFARALQFKRLSRLYALAFLFPLSLIGVANYALLQMGVWVLVLSLLLGCGALAALMFLLGSLEEKQALEIQLQETRHAMELEQAHYQSMEEQRKRLSHIRHDFIKFREGPAQLLRKLVQAAAKLAYLIAPAVGAFPAEVQVCQPGRDAAEPYYGARDIAGVN